MGRVMKYSRPSPSFFAPRVLLPRLAWAAITLGVIALLFQERFPFRTLDQQAYRLFRDGDPKEAADTFRDPMWKGTALFENGDFEEAAGLFAGYNTAEAAFNQGNALVMQGKYDDAAARYAHALALKPGWEDATINRQIALTRAERLKAQGGEGTGGMLEADEIVFGDQKPAPSAGDEQVTTNQATTDEELQATWLRQVQTKPADFLRAKFAYQNATRDRVSTPTEPSSTPKAPTP